MKRLFRILDFRPDPTQDVRDEIESHLEFEVERLIAGGLSEEEARKEAERRFGDRGQIESEAARHATRWEGKKRWTARFDTFRQDLPFAVRTLLRARGMTALTLLLLTLGIGGNTALFSTLKGVYLEPFPLPESQELVFLWERTRDNPESSVSFANYRDWREENRTFRDMCAYLARHMNLTDQGDPVRIRGALTTASLFPVLGVVPELGRPLSPDEDFSGTPVVVLSHGIWEGRYGADPDLVGREVDLDGIGHTVIGVMPATFQQPDARSLEPIEVWVPLPPGTEYEPRFSRSFQVLGRLRDGVDLEDAREDLGRIAIRLTEAYPESNAGAGIRAEPVHEILFGEAGGQLLLIFGAAGLVLLIACGNIASLQLARAPDRQTEIAVRAALGASRGRLLRLLLTESTLLSLVGGLTGFLAARWMLDALTGLIPSTIPRTGDLSLDGPVFLLAMGLSVLIGLFTGLAPALSVSRTHLMDTLKEGRRGGGKGGERRRLQHSFIVGQLALGLILANAALLLFQSYGTLRRNELGFEAENVLTMSLSLRGSGYSVVEGRAEFYDELFPLLHALPGVRGVGATTSLPLMGGSDMGVLTEDEWTGVPGGEPRTVSTERVAGDYFSTLGIPLLRGRRFIRGSDDGSLGDTRAILNQAAAEMLWPGEDPIGKRFSFGDEPPRWIGVVGVVGDARNQGLGLSPTPEVFLPYASFPPGQMVLTFKTEAEPTALVTSVLERIRRVDPLQAVSDIRTMEDVIQVQTSRRVFYTTLIGAFAGLALLLVEMQNKLLPALSDQLSNLLPGPA